MFSDDYNEIKRLKQERANMVRNQSSDEEGMYCLIEMREFINQSKL